MILQSKISQEQLHDLPDNLESSAKLFADDISLFSTVYNPLLSAEIINKDLIKISKRANQWNMYCKPDMTKQAGSYFLTEI